MQFSFFHNQKPRRYYHRPIYWDPEKDEVNEAVAKARQEAEENGKYSPTLRRGSFRRARFDNQEVDLSESVQRQRRSANLRFLIIVIALFAIAFFLYFSSGDFLNL